MAPRYVWVLECTNNDRFPYRLQIIEDGILLTQSPINYGVSSHYAWACPSGLLSLFCVLGEIPGKFRHAASHYRMLKEQRVMIRPLGKAVALSTPNCSNERRDRRGISHVLRLVS